MFNKSSRHFPHKQITDYLKGITFIAWLNDCFWTGKGSLAMMAVHKQSKHIWAVSFERATENGFCGSVTHDNTYSPPDPRDNDMESRGNRLPIEKRQLVFTTGKPCCIIIQQGTVPPNHPFLVESPVFKPCEWNTHIIQGVLNGKVNSQ